MGTKRDDKASTGRDDKADTGRDNKAGTAGQDDDGMGDSRRDGKADIGGQDDKRVAEPIVRAFCIEAQKLLRRAFFLATRSNSFLVFASSESVID